MLLAVCGVLATLTAQLQNFNPDIEKWKTYENISHIIVVVTKVMAAAESSETRTIQSPNVRSSMQRSTTAEAHVFAAGKPKMHEDQFDSFLLAININGLLDILMGFGSSCLGFAFAPSQTKILSTLDLLRCCRMCTRLSGACWYAHAWSWDMQVSPWHHANASDVLFCQVAQPQQA